MLDLELRTRTTATIAKGSLSFRFASLVFPQNVRDKVYLLYDWCRYVDDQIDLAHGKEEQLAAIARIETETRAALSGRPSAEPPIDSLRILHLHSPFPAQYAFDLLRGMRLDIDGTNYRSLEDLEDYCYCVAGTVGLIMCHIMGASDSKALRHAVDLGIAFQLSNIARDVFEDAQMQRIYLPLDWIAMNPEDAVSVVRHQDSNKMPLIVGAVDRLVHSAESYYHSAFSGLRYLPLRAALACGVALFIYRQIGRGVVKSGQQARRKRVVVALPNKIVLSIFAIFSLRGLFALRIHSPWRRELLPQDWRSL